MARATNAKQVKRTGVQVMLKLVGLVKPLLSVMVLAVLLGVTGFLCAIFLNVYGAEALAWVLGFHGPVPLKRMFILIIIFGVLRGILHYGEQLCNHYIAFHILALIRDKIFGALRKLSPAKLETKEKGNLISIITSDIELLEVFYAHTISPIMIAIITSALMLVFFWHLNPLMMVVAMCGYLLVGLFMPWLISVMGRETGSRYRNEFGDFDSYFLGCLRGVRETIQFGRQEDNLQEIGARTRSLSEKQKKMKMYSGLSIALTGLVVSAFSLIMLFLGVSLYENGSVTFHEVIVGTVAMMSSFGPVIALSGLANNLLHTFASGNRVLDILEETPVVEEVTDEHRHEGRVITAEYPGFYLVCCYTPNSQEGLKRLDYRMTWEDDLRAYLLELDARKPVVYCGDLNVAHEEIDIKNPKTNRRNAGFTDEERGKMTELLAAGFVDTFRALYPDRTGAYSWWSYRFNARKNNAGWRIDYFIVSERLRDKIRGADILSDVTGSDHCPVVLELET